MKPVPQLLSASDAVKALVGTDPIRVFRWGRAPANVAVPYVLWQTVSDTPAGTLDSPSMEHLRVQVDSYAADSTVCDQLDAAVRAAIELDGANPMIGLNLEGQDDTTNLYRISRDFSIWVDA